MNQTVDVSVLVVILSIVVSVCTIAGFLLGRKQAAKDTGKQEGSTTADLKHLSDSFSKMEKAIDSLSTKIDLSNERMAVKIDGANDKREQEYREMLVKATRLEESQKSLHKRIDFIEKICKIEIPKEE